jgi:hypothetical protein
MPDAGLFGLVGLSPWLLPNIDSAAGIQACGRPFDLAIDGRRTDCNVGARDALDAPSYLTPGVFVECRRSIRCRTRMLDAVHRGAGPVPPQDRRRFYTIIGEWLDACPLVTNRSLSDAIQAAQRQLLRTRA